MVDFLPSKQTIRVRFSLDASKKINYLNILFLFALMPIVCILQLVLGLLEVAFFFLLFLYKIKMPQFDLASFIVQISWFFLFFLCFYFIYTQAYLSFIGLNLKLRNKIKKHKTSLSFLNHGLKKFNKN